MLQIEKGGSMRKVGFVAVATLLLAACTNADDDAASTTTTTTVVVVVVPPAAVETVAPATAAPSTEAPVTQAPAAEVTATQPPSTEAAPETAAPESTAVPVEVRALLAGAASRSVLPTVDGSRAFLLDAPGWDDIDPNDPGVFVPEFDQGPVDVGNGNADASWVHDDLRTTAVAIRRDDQLVVMVTADVYMIFAVDAAEIERRARAMLPAELADSARIIISSTHNHHGPDTAFAVNDDWYDQMADEVAGTIDDAVDALRPAVLKVATGVHRFGVSDGRDPIIIDPRLNVMLVDAAADGARIATLVQWASHPETTLGWTPTVDLTDICEVKGWAPEDCTAQDRYFTADYPGVLRERIQAADGGEVLYFNGAIGVQIGPGDAKVWQVDAGHPVGDGWTVPQGAQPVAGAPDLDARNLARTQAIGEQLAIAVENLSAGASPLEVDEIVWSEQSFFTRLTNIGFRLLLADGDLGWQVPTAYTCGAKPFTDATCASDAGRFVDDPILTPLTGSRIREGDVLKSRLVDVDFGDAGFLFMPGELPPELVVGLPATFDDDPAPFYLEPELHALGADYAIPGYLLELVDDRVTFTVGLGGDELGYWVPIDEARMKCLDLVLPTGITCQTLFDQGFLVTPEAIGGPLCRTLADDPAAPDLLDISVDSPEYEALVATCRYGQALGRELGEPAGHYEETNSAGWDLVDDLFAAAETLFGTSATSGGINPGNRGETPMNPAGSG